MTLYRTDPTDAHYRKLVEALDRELAVTDGDDHAFYDQFNGSEDIHHVMVATKGERAVACGAIKAFDERTMEVKRMYTLPQVRGRGLAVELLRELEKWAAELGYKRLILETGSRQLAAIRLYEKYGFQRMAENYGQYAEMENSICFEKSVAG